MRAPQSSPGGQRASWPLRPASQAGPGREHLPFPSLFWGFTGQMKSLRCGFRSGVEVLWPSPHRLGYGGLAALKPWPAILGASVSHNWGVRRVSHLSICDSGCAPRDVGAEVQTPRTSVLGSGWPEHMCRNPRTGGWAAGALLVETGWPDPEAVTTVVLGQWLLACPELN